MNDILEVIKELQRRIEKLEHGIEIRNITVPADGIIIVRKLASDPASPEDGEIWYNTTSNKYKSCENGTIKTFTTS